MCDGKNTLQEMASAACAKGLTTLGFTGHSYTQRDREYCMSPSRTAQYKATIAKLKTEYKGCFHSIHIMRKSGKFTRNSQAHIPLCGAARAVWHGIWFSTSLRRGLYVLVCFRVFQSLPPNE